MTTLRRAGRQERRVKWRQRVGAEVQVLVLLRGLEPAALSVARVAPVLREAKFSARMQVVSE